MLSSCVDGGDDAAATHPLGGKGWLVKGKGAAEDAFVPFAFEVGGALGREAEEFLRECGKVAEWKNPIS